MVALYFIGITCTVIFVLFLLLIFGDAWRMVFSARWLCRLAHSCRSSSNYVYDDVSTITEATFQSSGRSEERVADCEQGMMQRIEMWMQGPVPVVLRCHCLEFESWWIKCVVFFCGTNLCRLYVVVNCLTMTKNPRYSMTCFASFPCSPGCVCCTSSHDRCPLTLL
jgi:hypothetical protein